MPFERGVAARGRGVDVQVQVRGLALGETIDAGGILGEGRDAGYQQQGGGKKLFFHDGSVPEVRRRIALMFPKNWAAMTRMTV